MFENLALGNQITHEMVGEDKMVGWWTTT